MNGTIRLLSSAGYGVCPQTVGTETGTPCFDSRSDHFVLSGWRTITPYLLGPLLNRLPSILLPAEAHSGFESFGSQPLVPMSGVQALWVVGAYALAFVVIALVPTWECDVKE